MTDMQAQSPDWWKGAVIYQIYPRSFQDTTGNGIGDLDGIRERLDHVARLGADAIWISPFVKSPMRDFGYDVSDYRAVDPLFGTMDSLKALIAAAHERGLRVITDQVLSHTSSEHPWFLESRASRDNPRADWYVWDDGKPDGSPPNNWISVFGGSSWQWEPRRGQFYLHNFLREQPDLNFHNPQVQEAVLEVCRFWLDLGVDGFRLDVCTFYAHDPELRDNPVNPDPPPGEVFAFNPYSKQLHLHDIQQPETVAFLQRLRQLCDGYGDRVLLGELHESDAVNIHREYTAIDRLHLAYGYWLLGAEEITPRLIRDLAAELGHDDDSGWPCWAVDNHDFKRAVTRLGAEEEPGKVSVILAALSCLRGALCLYQGSELGLPEAELAYEDIVDPYGREFWPIYKGRDGTRTPMPWQAEAAHGGFSAVRPWLPVPAAHLERAADRQEADPASVLSQLRSLLVWRRDQDPLRRGSLRFLDAPANVLAFERSSGGRTLTCLFNFSAVPTRMDLPPQSRGRPVEVPGLAGSCSAPDRAGGIDLDPYGTAFLSREEPDRG
ncbi:alpha-glucosidase family protein [Mangrovicoccus algicola]|uniref:Alpha-glucosidase n=1 Tax=Mangrovicoccus algicola TaxID=2771008 RepID=A0A8J7CUK5_9RHOB|nr:alpha-glucosidase family protein [Mangrovicoccus algicola]MBE3637619.1 alpha-glucosidase [Mangrovicoccus algicola]